MKNFTAIFFSLLGLFVSIHVRAINPPQVYTSAFNINTNFGLGTYVNDNFDDISNTATANLSYSRPVPTDANGYAYVVESRSSNAINDLLGALATSTSEAIYIRNTGTGNINMVGGYFGEVSTEGNKITPSTNNIRITVDNYQYEYKSTFESTLIGFIFPTAFTEVKIESLNGNCPAISRLYWGSSLPATATNNYKKEVLLFPNPTTDGITLMAEGKLTITSTLGQVLLSQSVKNNSYVSLSNLPKGMYIVTIESPTGSLQQKLVKK